MASKITAQISLNTGSFISSIVDGGELVKGKMYRVKSVKQDSKYVILDTDFCGTESLKGKSISFKDRFILLEEEDVKAEFKRLLREKTFVAGQEFLDVRDNAPYGIDSSSRTHILAKFGKFMGVKMAGGHVWFAGKTWATPMVDLETSPTEQEPEPEQELKDEFYVIAETLSEATHVCNTYGSPHMTNDWDVYRQDTCYRVDNKSNKVSGYCSLDFAEEGGKAQVLTYSQWDIMVNPQPKTEKQRKKVSMTGGSIEQQILAVVDEHLDSQEARDYMANSVEKLLNKWGIDKNVRQLEVSVNKAPAVKVGKVHFKYDLLLKCMMARTNVALVGAAGSGKTTTVSKCAETLGLKFYSKSVSAQTGAHEFFGYQDANGNYVRTLFREAYENGGVFLLDEFDAGNPNVLAALNQATANEHCAFADDMIPKHEDFICVMAGNTFGHGANSEYVGRNKIDAATLDRFAFIEFPYDEDLEHALAGNKDWCKKVQAFRRKVEQKKIRTIISPRATIIGSQLLANGVSEKEVIDLLIYKGLNKEELQLLK